MEVRLEIEALALRSGVVCQEFSRHINGKQAGQDRKQTEAMAPRKKERIAEPRGKKIIAQEKERQKTDQKYGAVENHGS